MSLSAKYSDAQLHDMAKQTLFRYAYRDPHATELVRRVAERVRWQPYQVMHALYGLLHSKRKQ